ncbi:hypothetical protein Bca52824_033394 [Brassica carinata]|uniref:Uncharacterized protein n=1 Tax=Brassica carinata TaxID=52824 RepID=A0A8X7SEM6_BRACI|nr:hypothetical protein Bca52824_033394 [Brassica carinata]
MTREKTNLINQDAPTLALQEMSGNGRQELRKCLEELTGKDYTYTTASQGRSRNQASVVDREGGQATTAMVDAVKITMGS